KMRDDLVLPVREVRGANEAGRWTELGKTVEHEHAPAEPVGAHLEGRTEAGKGVFSNGPQPGLARRRHRVVVLAVVEDGLEEPVFSFRWGRSLAVQEGNAIAVLDALHVALRVREEHTRAIWAYLESIRLARLARVYALFV